jgi:hypothetical protein
MIISLIIIEEDIYEMTVKEHKKLLSRLITNDKLLQEIINKNNRLVYNMVS